MYPITIEKHDYRVVLHSANRATVIDLRVGDDRILPHDVGVAKLLGKGDLNPKTAKNDVPTMGLSLYPADGAGVGNVCPLSIWCKKPCLAHQGQGPVPSVKAARVAKTVLFYLAREWFFAKLNRELARFRAAYPPDVEVGVRLNMFSDIRWECYGVIGNHSAITFYDYTKLPDRAGQIRANYWVTFSYDGHNWEAAEEILRAGGNVSVVFYDTSPGAKCGKAAHKQTLPEYGQGYRVIDGGKTDWRPEDPRGVIVGLRLLARTYASRDTAIADGFAVWAGAGMSAAEYRDWSYRAAADAAAGVA
jgi:hypothetical protein